MVKITDESGHRCSGRNCPTCESNVRANTDGRPQSGQRPGGTRSEGRTDRPGDPDPE
jgi:hypothetical protein